MPTLKLDDINHWDRLQAFERARENIFEQLRNHPDGPQIDRLLDVIAKTAFCMEEAKDVFSVRNVLTEDGAVVIEEMMRKSADYIKSILLLTSHGHYAEAQTIMRLLVEAGNLVRLLAHSDHHFDRYITLTPHERANEFAVGKVRFESRRLSLDNTTDAGEVYGILSEAYSHFSSSSVDINDISVITTASSLTVNVHAHSTILQAHMGAFISQVTLVSLWFVALIGDVAKWRYKDDFRGVLKELMDALDEFHNRETA